MALRFREQSSLLNELDARQNDVLHQLDALNERVETTLKEWGASLSEGAGVLAGDCDTTTVDGGD